MQPDEPEDTPPSPPTPTRNPRPAAGRLFVSDDLGPGAELALDPGQARYLTTVLRRRLGEPVTLFNGRDGEWRAVISGQDRKRLRLTVADLLRRQTAVPDLWLVFAVLKRGPTDLLVEKATELGAAELRPVFTARSNALRVGLDRVRTRAVEAAEQCGRLDVPAIREPEPLDRLLAAWPAGRALLFCDESGRAPPVGQVLAAARPGPWAILIGPEGGFSPAEREDLAARADVHAAALGVRTLRAETAAIAALALWQAVIGDWRS